MEADCGLLSREAAPRQRAGQKLQPNRHRVLHEPVQRTLSVAKVAVHARIEEPEKYVAHRPVQKSEKPQMAEIAADFGAARE